MQNLVLPQDSSETERIIRKVFQMNKSVFSLSLGFLSSHLRAEALPPEGYLSLLSAQSLTQAELKAGSHSFANFC